MGHNAIGPNNNWPIYLILLAYIINIDCVINIVYIMLCYVMVRYVTLRYITLYYYINIILRLCYYFCLFILMRKFNWYRLSADRTFGAPIIRIMILSDKAIRVELIAVEVSHLCTEMVKIALRFAKELQRNAL